MIFDSRQSILSIDGATLTPIPIPPFVVQYDDHGRRYAEFRNLSSSAKTLVYSEFTLRKLGAKKILSKENESNALSFREAIAAMLTDLVKAGKLAKAGTEWVAV